MRLFATKKSLAKDFKRKLQEAGYSNQPLAILIGLTPKGQRFLYFVSLLGALGALIVSFFVKKYMWAVAITEKGIFVISISAFFDFYDLQFYPWSKTKITEIKNSWLSKKITFKILLADNAQKEVTVLMPYTEPKKALEILAKYKITNNT